MSHVTASMHMLIPNCHVLPLFDIISSVYTFIDNTTYLSQIHPTAATPQPQQWYESRKNKQQKIISNSNSSEIIVMPKYITEECAVLDVIQKFQFGFRAANLYPFPQKKNIFAFGVSTITLFYYSILFNWLCIFSGRAGRRRKIFACMQYKMQTIRK